MPTDDTIRELRALSDEEAFSLTALQATFASHRGHRLYVDGMSRVTCADDGSNLVLLDTLSTSRAAGLDVGGAVTGLIEDAERDRALVAEWDATLPSLTPEPGLSEAWAAAEAAIAALGSHRLEVGHTPRGLDERNGKYRAWAVGLDTAWGDTPAAALRALAARLRTPVES